MAKKNYQIEVFHPSFLHAATVGGRGVCVLQTCTGAVSLQNRTRRHDAPYAAERMAAPMCISDLCRSSAVSPPPAGGIGVRVLPASAVLISNGDACAFLARQEKPKTQPASHAAKKEFSIIRSAQHMKPRISAPRIP